MVQFLQQGSEMNCAQRIRQWLAIACLLCVHGCALTQADPLASWNDGAAKRAIVAFVSQAAVPGSPGYIPPADRLATFDNDGTLWAEQPLYFQFLFVLDRVKALAPQHPEWKTRQPFKAALDGDLEALAASGEHGLKELVMATHTGMSTDEFSASVAAWIATARHPRLQRPYTTLVYQPMRELLCYLRANGFTTYIVTGGTADFVRGWSETVYGVRPEQVIGTTFVTRLQVDRDGKPQLFLEPELEFLDDGPGKPVAIHKFIGRRPVFSFGNSDGDLQMLQWVAAGNGPTFMGLVRHTDGQREWAYDRQSRIGKLDKALDHAQRAGWTVVDMRKDWKTVFPQTSPEQAKLGQPGGALAHASALVSSPCGTP
jgi:hypothetical protein